MALLNVFEQNTTDLTLNRLEKLSSETNSLWGSMNAGQMLAHLNVAYDSSMGKQELKKDGWFTKLMMKKFVKGVVVGEKPYKRNNRTAPHFIISTPKDFGVEKDRLITNIKEVQEKGVNHFNNKESHSFGKLSQQEWSNLFYKHLDHHFQQFGI